MSEPFAYAVVTETGRVHRLIRSEGFADEVANELRQSSTEAVDVVALYTADAIREAVEAERERCCGIIYGMCESDNVAKRTVDAIKGGAA